MGRVACSAAAALRARPANTSLESAAVLLDSPETAVNRVSSVCLHCFSVHSEHVEALAGFMSSLIKHTLHVNFSVSLSSRNIRAEL